MDEPQETALFGDALARQGRLPCQLYLISPPEIAAGFDVRLRSAIEAAPVAAFQFRVKATPSEHELARLAEPLQKVCADLDVAFIVNDSISLAKRLGADGVHLGQGDGDPREARDILGRDAQIGVTCHNSRHLAMEAGEAGADYVAFGAFFQSGTKNVKYIADTDIVRWWTVLSPIPCVAIGGITADNAAPIVAAGADFIAVSGAVWNDPDGPAAGAARFSGVLSA
jgi:thiamine-phosphate pyrophosphorylase